MSEDKKSEVLAKEYPGKINVADVRGNYPGCEAKEFKSAEEMNAFFSENPNRLVVMIAPRARAYPGGIKEDVIFCLYTKVVTEEELREQAEVQEEVNKAIEKRRAARAEVEEKVREERIKQEQEQKRLIEVGRKCEHHHASLVEENRKLKKGKGK